MKYLVMVLVAVTIISLFQYAQAREIGPFMFGLADEEGDWIKHSDSSSTHYYGILNHGQTINLPLKIIAGSVPTPLAFHATIGEQMGPEKLPRGIKVEIEPKSFLIEPEKDVTLNIFITAEKNAPPNVYSIGIVGVWPEPINNFSGTSVTVHVGRYFGSSAVPDNFFPPPLKQIKEGSLPSDVVCTNDFVLIIKNNGNPACVKPTSVQKLIDRGWPMLKSPPGEIPFGIEIPKPKNLTLQVTSVDVCSWMTLDKISPNSLTQRKDWAGANANIMNIGEEELAQVPHLKEMINEMKNSTGFIPNEYDENVMGKQIPGLEVEHSKIFDWLRENFEKQYAQRGDGGFSSFFKYNEDIYTVSWALC